MPDPSASASDVALWQDAASARGSLVRAAIDSARSADAARASRAVARGADSALSADSPAPTWLRVASDSAAFSDSARASGQPARAADSALASDSARPTARPASGADSALASDGAAPTWIVSATDPSVSSDAATPMGGRSGGLDGAASFDVARTTARPVRASDQAAFSDASVRLGASDQALASDRAGTAGRATFDSAAALDRARASRLPTTARDPALWSDSARGSTALASDAAVSTDAARTFRQPGRAADSAYSNDRATGGPPGARGIDFALSHDRATAAQPLVHVRAFPLVRVVARFSCFVTPLTAPEVPGAETVGDLPCEVVVVDKFGYAYGQIVSAVVQEIDDNLNDLSECSIDFWIDDPVFSLGLTPHVFSSSDLPGGREIQVWLGGELFFWGVPVSATYDASTVHLRVMDLIWYLSMRNFGPNPFNLLTNPGFESVNLDGSLPGWTFQGNGTFDVISAPEPGQYVLEGNHSLFIASIAGSDSWAEQNIPFTNNLSVPVTYDVSAWVYVPVVPPGGTVGPVSNSWGLVVQAIVDLSVISGSPQVQTLDDSTPQGQWNRFDVSVVVPPTTAGVLNVRLYGPQIGVIWDVSKLTTNLSVGMTPDLNPVPPNDQIDVFDIISNVLAYAQDPTWGGSPLNLPVVGGATGQALTRAYNLSDNGGILDALNEFPTIGICDFQVLWSADGHGRWLQVFSPAKGSTRWNFPLELDGGLVTELQGAVDGSQTGTAQRVLGQGSSGSSQDVGHAAFPSYLGGKVLPSTLAGGGANLRLGSTSAATLTAGFFSPSDVGQGIYSLSGAIPLGSIIVEYRNSARVIFSTPNSSLPDQGALFDIDNDTIGVGGLILDNVTSAIQDLPITTLQRTANQNLSRQLAANNIPAPKFKMGQLPATLDPFSNLVLGDVVPVVFNLGWLQINGPLMRIVGWKHFPTTGEVAPVLNLVNGAP